MPPKNRGVKMSLDSFLNDESLGGGSWADDDVDFSSIQIPVTSKNIGGSGATGQANLRDPAFGGLDAAPRRDRVEYPIPDAPPYRARLNNLAWEATEESIADWFAQNLDSEDAVLKVVAPRDHEDPTRLKGFAFVTFNTREQLEKALTFSSSEIEGRRVFVNVAQPERESSFGSRRSEGGPDLDWGSARGSGILPQREEREPRERRPRREEPNLDWGSARGSGVLPPREPREPRGPREPREDRPKREEPNLDWGSARGSGVLPPREPREPREDRPKREEPNLDWGSARGSGVLPPREPRAPREPREPKERKPKRDEAELDWGSARGSGVLPPKKANTTREGAWTRGQKAPARSSAPAEETAKPVGKKSLFSVLAVDDDEEDVEELQDATKSLTVDDSSN